MADEILIVEDDDSIRRLLRISLKTEGYRVSEAKSATVALSLFEANAPVLTGWRCWPASARAGRPR